MVTGIFCDETMAKQLKRQLIEHTQLQGPSWLSAMRLNSLFFKKIQIRHYAEILILMKRTNMPIPQP